MYLGPSTPFVSVHILSSFLPHSYKFYDVSNNHIIFFNLGAHDSDILFEYLFVIKTGFLVESSLSIGGGLCGGGWV